MIRLAVPALAICGFAQAAAALTVDDANRMISVFEQRCLAPLLAGAPPNTDGLRAPGGENAAAYGTSLTDDDILMLSRFASAGLYTCTMEHSALTAPITPADYSQIKAALQVWLDAKIATGTFIEDTSCHANAPYWERRLIGLTETRPGLFLSLYSSASESYRIAALSLHEIYGPPDPACPEAQK